MKSFFRTALHLALLPAALATLAPHRAAAQADEDLFRDMKARSIGPAGMSGRVAAVDVVLRDRNTIYVGGATGGLFRSSDGGLQWEPVFDDEPALGIGAISVFQPNPDIVWVGTGEGNPRNSAGVGQGVFRSMDGGNTWTFMGLGKSERIARVLTHPTNPDIVYVGAMGPAWSDGEERGVYRTRDGGQTWERILWQNPSTGVADLVMDPSNPDHLFAAMWQFRRDPWFFTSGGAGSGLFETYDGGDSWRRLGPEDGLPTGELGRIGLAISPSSPNVVYALVEATLSALIRSDDGGRSFHTISDRPGVASRPFYFGDIRVDPKNENRLYSLESSIRVSDDQGRTWRTVVNSGVIHGDVHELWIDPVDPRRMIIGEDGGIAFTSDRGDTWRFVENLTLAQFYHVSVDNDIPFNVYGGLQDNGSWYGPSTVWENKGILNAYWHRVGGGDGFSVLNDPSSPHAGYSMSQQGSLTRFDKVTGLQVDIQPVHPDGTPLRFNWNAGLALDPIDSTTIYLGSQFLHRSRDHGQSWDIISPDLTTNDPAKQRQMHSGGLTLDATGAENHTTIIAIAPSPLQEGLIWVGTDDGNVQLTRDDGATWTNVRPNFKGVPDATWVPDIEASKQDAGTAFVVFDDHRRGNWETYVFRTRDYGAHWERLAQEGVDGFAHTIAQDPVEPRLLFLGTEFGLYFSTDDGTSWSQWTSGVPSVPIRDALVHPRDGDLVLATHGRGMLILDDVRPLRAVAAGAAGPGVALDMIAPPPAYAAIIGEAIGYRSTGMAMQQGENRPYGALLSFWSDADGEARLEVRDTDEALVWSRAVAAHRGVNRIDWDLRPGGEADEERFPRMADVVPGRYAVSVHLADATSQADLEVRGDPRYPVAAADLTARNDALRAVIRVNEVLEEGRKRLQSATRSVDGVLAALPDDSGDLRAEARTVRDALQQALHDLYTGPDCQGICGGDVPAARVRSLASSLNGLPGAPGANDRLKLQQAEAVAGDIADAVNRVFSERVAPFRDALRSAGYTPFPVLEPLKHPGA